MDEWLELFHGTLLRLHEEAGIPVVFAYRNTGMPDEFVWARTFLSEDSVEDQERVFFLLPERVALGDVRGAYVEELEVRVLAAELLG